MSKKRRLDPDDYAETQVLQPAGASSERPRTEAEVEALYQEYVRACEEAGLEPLPPRPPKR
jgi:hypothetical protein